MDSKWEAIISNMGHSTTIFPQTSLDDVANFNGFDILVLTNGLIQLTPLREETLHQYVAQGGNAYIQSEYQVTQPGSEAFEYVVGQLGGTFTWVGETNGNLTPMNISGALAEGVASMTAVDHFWYGAYGIAGDYTTPFLTFQDKHYGFIFCSPNPTHGKIVTTSDQDWMRLDHSKDLARNIIHFLSTTPVLDIPSIFVSVSNSQPCANEPVTFTANVGSTPATINYQWLVNDVEVPAATSSDFVAIFNNGDLVHCQITFSEDCGSQTVNTPQLEVLTTTSVMNTPTINITTNTTTICSAETITALATTTDTQGLNDLTYQWTLNNQPIVGATNPTLQFNTLNDADVLNCQLSYTTDCSGDQDLTSNELTFTVNEITTPSVLISSDFTNICAGEAVHFTANAVDAGDNPSYRWKVDGNAVGENAANFITSNLTNGQAVTCEVTSNDACATTNNVTSNALAMSVSTPVTPELIVQADQTTICAGETATFTATTTNAGMTPQLEWFVDGISTGLNNTTFTTNNLTNQQVVTCQLISTETCVTTNAATSTPIQMEVNEALTPSIEITSDATMICAGTAVTFTATGENMGANPQLEWFINGTTTGNTNNTYNTTFTNNETVSCVLTATNTCSGTITTSSNEIEISIGGITLEIMEIQPERCDNSNGKIEIKATGGMAPYTFNWDNNTINTTNTLNQIPTGDYAVVVTDVNGCSAALEINVPYFAAPEIEAIATQNIDCNQTQGSAVVTMTQPNADYFYSWKNLDNKVIANGAQVTNLDEGLYILEVTDAYDCMTSEEIFIEAQAPLQVEILEMATIQLGETQQLAVVTNNPDATFEWAPNPTLSCENCMTPTIQPTHATTYFLTTTTDAGCTMTTQVTVQVAKPRNVFVPNAFSPNNDGINDHFAIFGGTDVAQVKSFQVFDRWGAVVFSNENFQANDEQEGWNGKIGNKKLGDGVFIYFAEIEFTDGRTDVYKGDVTITP